MSDLATQVPESVIIATFAGVMAISPTIYSLKLKKLAEQCGVPFDDAFREYVSEVLKKLPPAEFD
jgi:hypothetical protein